MDFDYQMFNIFEQQMANNRDIVILTERALFNEAILNGNEKKYLNLGCGERILNGFINVDKYFKNPNIINFDIFQLPFEDSTIDAIFCAHVLEHLPIRHSRLAIQEWARVLKQNSGYLYLGIPDVELIFEYYKIKQDTDLFLITLFGFQTDPENRGEELDYPVNHGHFHTCGFTKATIKEQLEKNGFIIEELYNYDGWGTPSIWVKAHM